ncbi:MAG: hypothetical protein GXP08_08605 [Gammaproteobacteria bacterium]|nr:hypothetical protein [Gammaproteobacteria bacterium]
MKDRICINCGHIGKPIPQCLDSFLVDGLLWLAVGSIAIFTGLMPLFLIPTAWTVYHIAKYNTTKCPKCENLDMVSQKSRAAKNYLSHKDDHHIEVWHRKKQA